MNAVNLVPSARASATAPSASSARVEPTRKYVAATRNEATTRSLSALGALEHDHWHAEKRQRSEQRFASAKAQSTSDAVDAEAGRQGCRALNEAHVPVVVRQEHREGGSDLGVRRIDIDPEHLRVRDISDTVLLNPERSACEVVRLGRRCPVVRRRDESENRGVDRPASTASPSTRTIGSRVASPRIARLEVDGRCHEGSACTDKASAPTNTTASADTTVHERNASNTESASDTPTTSAKPMTYVPIRTAVLPRSPSRRAISHAVTATMARAPHRTSVDTGRSITPCP